MNITIPCGARSGHVYIPSSKSLAHRALICAALGNRPMQIKCCGISSDIRATMDCLSALGADIAQSRNSISVSPIRAPKHCSLPCRESGSTLRFLLPIVGTLDIEADFIREGRLAERPIEPFLAELSKHGMSFSEDGNTLHVCGKLQSGTYAIAGNISSQYISALLMGLPRLAGNSTLQILGNIESVGYIAMTESMLQSFGIALRSEHNTYVIENQPYISPEKIAIEGDYSNAAFFLCMGALSANGVCVSGLPEHSMQGDAEILSILQKFGADVVQEDSSVTVRRSALRGQIIDAAQIPDLIPAVCALASAADGETHILRAERLRYKESDRLHTIADMLSSLGADIREESDSLRIVGKKYLRGGMVNAHNDHRIAMAAAVAACACAENVTIAGYECVSKSYPDFWDDFARLKEEIL